MPDPGTIQWPSHSYMLASVVIVMVVLGNVRAFRDRQCLSDHQDSKPQPVGCVSASLLPVSLGVSHVEVCMFH